MEGVSELLTLALMPGDACVVGSGSWPATYLDRRSTAEGDECLVRWESRNYSEWVASSTVTVSGLLRS